MIPQVDGGLDAEVDAADASIAQVDENQGVELISKEKTKYTLTRKQIMLSATYRSAFEKGISPGFSWVCLFLFSSDSCSFSRCYLSLSVFLSSLLSFCLPILDTIIYVGYIYIYFFM
jgi:hypothetical protein